MKSINFGIRLEDDAGKVTEHSFLCSADTKLQPYRVLERIITMLNDECGTSLYVDGILQKVKFSKPPKIKANRGLSHKAFNKKIKELGYE